MKCLNPGFDGQITYKAGYRSVPLTELSKKGKLGQNDPPLPKIIFCVISRPILQISATMRCLYPGFDG